MSSARSLVVLASVLTLSACVQSPARNGFDEVAGRVRQQTGQDIQWQRTEEQRIRINDRVRQLLSEPLTVDSVVAIGLLNNRNLQRRFDELDIADSALREAELPPNPVFGAGRRGGDGFSTTDLGLEFNITQLIWRAPLVRMQNENQRRAQAEVADAVLATAMQLRVAFYTWQAAQQKAEMMRTVASATDAAAQLAQGQYQAGTASRRDRARQQAFHAENQLAADQARLQADAAREQLNRLMALWGEQTQWRASTRLREAPAVLPAIEQPETVALSNSAALAAARADLTYYAQALDLTRSSRFLNLVTVGLDYEKQTGEPRELGPSLSLELPVFNTGDARVQRQVALYRQAEQRLYQLAVETRSDARERWWRWQAAHVAARHYRQRILPLYQEILEETQKHYNGMLDDIYTLLADRRAQINAGASYIEALRDFWINQAQLEQTLGTHFAEGIEPSEISNRAAHEGH